MVLNPPPYKYLYHYTTCETALEHILKLGKIRFSPLEFTNDPKESKDWNFGVSTVNGIKEIVDFKSLNKEVSQKIKRNWKVLCMTRDDPRVGSENGTAIGYSHARMWAQYAGNHTGVCLVFDGATLRRTVDRELSKKCDILQAPVSYVSGSSGDEGAFTLDYDNITEIGLDSALREHVNIHWQKLFFQKNVDWSAEWEYRWLVRNEISEYEYVSIKDSIRSILVGANFPKERRDELIILCKVLEMDAGFQNWTNGHPTPQLGVLYSPHGIPWVFRKG